MQLKFPVSAYQVASAVFLIVEAFFSHALLTCDLEQLEIYTPTHARLGKYFFKLLFKALCLLL